MGWLARKAEQAARWLARKLDDGHPDREEEEQREREWLDRLGRFAMVVLKKGAKVVQAVTGSGTMLWQAAKWLGRQLGGPVARHLRWNGIVYAGGGGIAATAAMTNVVTAFAIVPLLLLALCVYLTVLLVRERRRNNPDEGLAFA